MPYDGLDLTWPKPSDHMISGVLKSPAMIKLARSDSLSYKAAMALFT